MVGWIILIIIFYIGFSISFFIGSEQQRKIDKANYERMIRDTYISKYKIRDKIDELIKERNKYKGTKGLEFSRTGLINAQKQVLQELLEE